MQCFVNGLLSCFHTIGTHIQVWIRIAQRKTDSWWNGYNFSLKHGYMLNFIINTTPQARSLQTVLYCISHFYALNFRQKFTFLKLTRLVVCLTTLTKHSGDSIFCLLLSFREWDRNVFIDGWIPEIVGSIYILQAGLNPLVITNKIPFSHIISQDRNHHIACIQCLQKPASRCHHIQLPSDHQNQGQFSSKTRSVCLKNIHMLFCVLVCMTLQGLYHCLFSLNMLVN